MKKVAMYRRGRGGPNDGLKEKIVWLLSTGPMTGRQLHLATKLPIRSIHRQLNAERHLISATAEISAGEWYIDEETGQRDRLYTLVRTPRRVITKAKANKTIVVSIKSRWLSAEKISDKPALRRLREGRGCTMRACGLHHRI